MVVRLSMDLDVIFIMLEVLCISVNLYNRSGIFVKNAMGRAEGP